MHTITKCREAQSILIFKSNIKTQKDVEKVDRAFRKMKVIHRWTVDLDDWEKVLKVETNRKVKIDEIADLVMQLGYHCAELDH
jgi:hypothetical protein